MLYHVSTAETTETYDSFAEAQEVANRLVFQYGEPDVNIVDDDGVPYDMHIELEPHITGSKWCSGIDTSNRKWGSLCPAVEL